MVEIAIVLTIVGLLIGAIWVIAATVHENYQVDEASKELLQIAAAVQQNGGWAGLAGGNNAAFVNMGIFPSNMLSNDSTACAIIGSAPCALDPWGGNVNVGVVSSSGFSSGSGSGSITVGAGTGTMYMLLLSAESCTKLLMATVPSLAQTYGLTAFGVTSDPTNITTGSFIDLMTPPVNINSVASACAQIPGLGANAAVGFVF